MDKPEVGMEYKVEIDSLGSKGDGIAKLGNFVIIIPRGEVGNAYRIRITNVREKYAFGEIV